MKICLYPYTEGSGIGTYTIELANALNRYTQNKIFVIGESEELARRNSIEFYHTPKTPLQLFGSKIKQLPPFSYVDPFLFGRRLSSLVNAIHPDIMQTSDHLPYHQIKAPVIGVGWDYPKGLADSFKLAKKYSTLSLLPYRFIREIEMSIKDHFAVQKCKLMLGVTKHVTEMLAKKGYNAIYFPPGITMPQITSKKNDVLSIAFVGRHTIWTKRKGLRYLLDALTMVKRKNPNIDFNLFLIGEVPSGFDNVMQKYSMLSKHIYLIGLVSRDKTLELIAKSHLLVAPSLYDEFGYAVLEAQSLGTPALVSKGNISFSEMVNDRKLAVNIFNRTEFADALEALMKNKNYLLNLGMQAKKFVEQNYSWEKKVVQLVREDEKVVG